MSGQDIRTKPVNQLLIRAVLETEPIPDYPDFDGEPLTLERLDDKSAWKSKARRKRAYRAWSRFAARVNAIQVRRNDKLFKLLLTKGVDLDVPPLDEWSADGDIDLQELGIDDSTPPGTRKLLYLHKLKPDPMDKIELLVDVMEKSGLETAPVADVQALFREALGAVEVVTPAGNGGGKGKKTPPKKPEFQRHDTGLEELDQAIAYDLANGDQE